MQLSVQFSDPLKHGAIAIAGSVQVRGDVVLAKGERYPSSDIYLEARAYLASRKGGMYGGKVESRDAKWFTALPEAQVSLNLPYCHA